MVRLRWRARAVQFMRGQRRKEETQEPSKQVSACKQKQTRSQSLRRVHLRVSSQSSGVFTHSPLAQRTGRLMGQVSLEAGPQGSGLQLPSSQWW